MAPLLSSTASRIAILLLRVLTFVPLSLSLKFLISSNSAIEFFYVGGATLRVLGIKSYEYMIATIVIGFSYTLLQIIFGVYNVFKGKHLLNGDWGFLLDFYGDKFISYVLVTGAAVGFGVTTFVEESNDKNPTDLSNFYNKAYASAGLLLLAFVCTAILSVLSSYTLPKKV